MTSRSGRVAIANRTPRSRRSALVPGALKPGDRVAVLAPGYPARDQGALREGLEALRGWGLVPQPGRALGQRRGYFAGTDEERARDLQEAVADPDVRGILFVRGGWGTSRLLPLVDLTPLGSQRKLLVGYSDLTVLFAEAWRRFRLVCGYGPMVPELAEAERFHLPSLRRALFRPTSPLRLSVPRGAILSRGGGGAAAPGARNRAVARSVASGSRDRAVTRAVASGPLIGGCLTLLAHLCGGGRLPDSRGAVVFFEEIAEEPYRIDRMLWQLRDAGFIGPHCAAVLVGQMTACEPRPGIPSLSLAEVLGDHLGGLGIPVLTGIPSGHGDGKWTLPLGFQATVNGTTGTIHLRP